MGEISSTCRVAAAALILARGTKALLIGERASQPDAGIILILMLALTAEAAWNAVPPDLRPVLKKYEQQRVEFVNEKVRAPGRRRSWEPGKRVGLRHPSHAG